MLRYAITDRIRLAADEPARQAALLAQAVLLAQAALLDQAARLAAEGIDFIQLREKDLAAAALADLARTLLATLRANPARPAPKLLINSRADIAVATRADGVHLTSAPGSLTPAQVRALYAAANLPAPIVSLSCHTLAEIAHAASANSAERPTHILFGPVFEKVVAEKIPLKISVTDCANNRPKACVPTPSIATRQVSSGTGLDLLRAACHAAAPIPVLALGGITPDNTPACLAAGAAGIAAIRLFLSPSATPPS